MLQELCLWCLSVYPVSSGFSWPLGETAARRVLSVMPIDKEQLFQGAFLLVACINLHHLQILQTNLNTFP